MQPDEDATLKEMQAKANALKQTSDHSTDGVGDSTSDNASSSDSVSPTFKLKVHSPYKVYYEELAFSISAENDTGPFDILPGHKNFLTLLRPCDLIIRNYRGEETIHINRGVLHVKSDESTIFLDV